MIRAAIIVAVLLGFSSGLFAQNNKLSIGLLTGFTSSFSWDEGSSNDSRYSHRYDVKLMPIGFSYGVDYNGHGFLVSPTVMSIGRNYNVVNAFGQNSGVKKTSLTYFNVPLAFKFNAIELNSLKVSFVTGFGVGYLMKAGESISHDSARYHFPEELYPALPSNYTVETNGVNAPEVTDFEISRKADHKILQGFVFFGLRTDWDVIENWRFSVDFRANFAVVDSRIPDYLESVDDLQEIYVLPGNRREIFATVTVGLARVITLENADPRYNAKRIQTRKSKPKATNKRKIR